MVSENGLYKMMDRAPIVVFVYNRADHAKRLLDSLSMCDGSVESEVFIFSDGPKESEDESINESNRKRVNEVRSLIHDSMWNEKFKSITVTEAEKNKGLANSIISGVTDIINRYGKVIVLEDDLVLAEGFLDYMNQALNAYQDDEEIFAISGWTYPCKGLKSYDKDGWLYYRACSWGWGTWKDRWANVIFDPIGANFEGKLANKEWCDKFCRGGNDLPNMLRMQLEGKRDSWAIRWNAAASDLDMMTLYPRESFVINEGRDGSGVHCGEASYEQGDFACSKVSYDFNDIKPNEKLIKQAWHFESDTLSKKIKRNLKTIFVEHKVPNVVKKLVGIEE